MWCRKQVQKALYLYMCWWPGGLNPFWRQNPRNKVRHLERMVHVEQGIKKKRKLSLLRVKAARKVLVYFFFLRAPKDIWRPWWLRQERVCLQCGRPGFDSCVRKFSWRRKWEPTPVFLPGESHGRRSLAGYSPRGRKELARTERLHFQRYLRPVSYLG